MIDHAEVRERLELAAVEPGGLDRLAAGDTGESAAIAGHLAGCPSCTEEARRLAQAAPVIAAAARAVPPEALRERTLTLVRETGRPRGRAAAEPTAELSGVAGRDPSRFRSRRDIDRSVG